MVQNFVPRSGVGMFRNERTRSTPLDPKLMCLVHFVQFWCIGERLVELKNSVQNGRYGAKVRATKSRRNFLQRTHPIRPIGP